MKHFLWIVILVCIVAAGYAGQKAITDTGRTVVLKDDGTWFYEDQMLKPEKKMEINTHPFSRPSDSTSLVKSNRNKTVFWVNGAKWSFKQMDDGSPKEFMFKFKDTDGTLHAIAITERLELPLATVAKIAFKNVQSSAQDVKLIQQEYRTVNGRKVVFMEMQGIVEGVEVSYLGYYYSGPAGCTQLMTITLTTLLKTYRSEMMDFLNGLDLQASGEDGAG